MYGDLLPIGSIVLLKGAEQRVMIVGRIVAMEGDDTVFDYCACLYPEGLSTAEQMVFFNRDAIELVYFIGFQDGEELRYRSEFLASLGELYVNGEGQIVERGKPAEGAQVSSDRAPEGPAVGDPVEAPVFADVEP